MYGYKSVESEVTVGKNLVNILEKYPKVETGKLLLSWTLKRLTFSLIKNEALYKCILRA